jgi:hypothetical protein
LWLLGNAGLKLDECELGCFPVACAWDALVMRHELVRVGVVGQQLDTCIVFDLVKEASFSLLQNVLVVSRLAKLIYDLHGDALSCCPDRSQDWLNVLMFGLPNVLLFALCNVLMFVFSSNQMFDLPLTSIIAWLLVGVKF